MTVCIDCCAGASAPGDAQDPQEIRLELILQFIADGVFQKVDPAGADTLKVWVRPAFYSLDFEQMQSAVGIVYGYYLAESRYRGSIVLRDAASGEDVGKYHPQSGGLTMQ